MEDQQNKLRTSHRKAVEAIANVETRLETKVSRRIHGATLDLGPVLILSTGNRDGRHFGSSRQPPQEGNRAKARNGGLQDAYRETEGDSGEPARERRHHRPGQGDRMYNPFSAGGTRTDSCFAE